MTRLRLMPRRSEVPDLVLLASPESEIELVLLKSIFDEAGIAYFVKNDAFGSLAPGPLIDHYNRKSIYVHWSDLECASDLLAELRAKTGGARRPGAERYTLGDKLRMILEFFLFGWIVPGRRPERRPELRLIRGDKTPGSRPR